MRFSINFGSISPTIIILESESSLSIVRLLLDMMRKCSKGLIAVGKLMVGKLRLKEVLVPPKNCHRDNVGRSLI